MKYKKELEKIMDIIGEYKKGISLQEITKILGWSPKHKKNNRNIVENWVDLGFLFKTKGGKYIDPKHMGYVTGELDVVKNRFAFVDTPDFSVFVPKSKFNMAFAGDEVMVKITKDGGEGQKKEGEVVKVTKRNSNRVIGIFEKSDNFGFVVPTQSFGKDIFIPKKHCLDLKDKKLVLCEVTDFGGDGKKPEGRLLEVLGDPYDTDTMIEALIRREGLSEDFPFEVLREIDYLKHPNEEGFIGRKDLRNLPIITIDGADAKDLDDAVYVEKLDKGYKLIVSIADVSHYVGHGSALDKEAYKRGNSVYLVDRVIPMLPKALSNDICSLNPQTEKFTLTCEMIFDENGKLKDHDIYKSVIKTVERMTYADVNKILAEDEEMTAKYAHIKDMCFLMKELSGIIRKIKTDRGSIDFDLPEIKVVLDEDNKVKYLKNRDRGESERIIEDFMIAANETVAEKIFWLEIPSLYRTHEKPDAERIERLNESLDKFGYKIHGFDDLHPGRFQKIIEQAKEDGNNLIVHKQILMALKQARYTKDNLGHFGLSSSYYTHFTSPIRRYADLIVHRILSELSNGYPSEKKIKFLENNLDEIGTHISKTERKAMKIEEESVKIKVVEYMMDKIGEVYKAKVTGMNKNGVFFETIEHVECYFNVINDNHYWDYDEKSMFMKNNDTGEHFQLGDEIEVMIARADLKDLEIEVVPYKSEDYSL